MDKEVLWNWNGLKLVHDVLIKPRWNQVFIFRRVIKFRNFGGLSEDVLTDCI